MSVPAASVRLRSVEPARLSAEQRARFADRLYACHQRIFAGVDRASFLAYVVDSPAQTTRIAVLEDEQGELRGYAAFHVFLHELSDGPVAVLRMECGLESAWRRKSLFGPFVLRQFARARLGYPLRRMLFLASFVHPSAYVAMHRHAPAIWPCPDAPTPGPMAGLMAELAEAFAMKPTARQGAYDIGWVTRGQQRAAGSSPAARFFVERNPRYPDGEGLLTVIPLGFGALLRGMGSFLARKLRGPQRPPRQELSGSRLSLS